MFCHILNILIFLPLFIFNQGYCQNLKEKKDSLVKLKTMIKNQFEWNGYMHLQITVNHCQFETNGTYTLTIDDKKSEEWNKIPHFYQNDYSCQIYLESITLEEVNDSEIKKNFYSTNMCELLSNDKKSLRFLSPSDNNMSLEVQFSINLPQPHDNSIIPTMMLLIQKKSLSYNYFIWENFYTTLTKLWHSSSTLLAVNGSFYLAHLSSELFMRHILKQQPNEQQLQNSRSSLSHLFSKPNLAFLFINILSDMFNLGLEKNMTVYMTISSLIYNLPYQYGLFGNKKNPYDTSSM